VLPTVIVPKLKLLVDNVTGAIPVPDKVTICGLFPALSVKVKVPLIGPVAVGDKVKATLQCVPAARLVPQVLIAIENGAAVVIDEIESATACALVNVTDWFELVAPTTTEPNFKVLADSVTGAAPLPDRVTVCGLFPASSVKVKVPGAEPVADGEKATPTVQCAPAARGVPQVLLVMANGPDCATPEILRTTF
jgi:hypothetical protein